MTSSKTFGPPFNMFDSHRAAANRSFRLAGKPVGALEGNIDDQNDDLLEDFDPIKFRPVTIWSRPVGADFGTALPTLQTS